ncbi:MAG: hypothetical protein DWQ36_20005 [Acidobacteria bacterium]|nr:MAG: hypothetical protein DWQ30_08360 [Acidobacteriota bacterium]REK03573.1 MAG: hypothetical protein DWQ36_20005 [Acidobacteriota bacterium]
MAVSPTIAARVFAVLLALSGALTGLLGVRTLVDPEGMMTSFGVALGTLDDVKLLVAVLGSVIVSLAGFTLAAAAWSWQRRDAGRNLGLLAALSLLFVAACAYGLGGSAQVLVLDGVRGGVLLVSGIVWRLAES